MKKIINEQQLIAMVTEATRKVLNEVGDTPEGRQAIKRAMEKSSSLGRISQTYNIKQGLQRANTDAFRNDKHLNDNAHERYMYENVDGRTVVLRSNGSFYVKDSETFDVNKFLQFADYIGVSCLKTNDRTIARKIVQWINEYGDDTCKTDKTLDWHNWAY